MDRRQFPRMITNLPIGYQVQLKDDPEPASGQGLLENISQGGMYFSSSPPPWLFKGDLGNFTLHTAPDAPFPSRLTAWGKVVRIEPLARPAAAFGIAVQFLGNLNIELLS
jgi:hypothetical protein